MIDVPNGSHIHVRLGSCKYVLSHRSSASSISVRPDPWIRDDGR
jgi:hypothetical protein